MPEAGILAWACLDGQDLDSRYAAIFGNRFRRVGRYVKLSLLGSHLCRIPLPDDHRLGIFLGTGLGNTADVIPLAEGVLRPGRPWTSPMAFAGCVGNAASFFVAKTWDTAENNVAVSQEELSFEAALMEAQLSLAEGECTHALVGGVDVLSGSEAEQRQRMNAVDVPGIIGEGAAFVMLGPVEAAPAVLEEVWMGPEADRVVPPGYQTLLGWRFPGIERENRLVPIASGMRMVDSLGRTGRYLHVQRNASGIAAGMRWRCR